MRHQKSLDAVRLVWPHFGRRTVRAVRPRDGVATLKRRALIRAASIWLRPINVIAGIIALAVLLAGEHAMALPLAAVFAIMAIILEKGSEAPKRRRAARIVRDVRPMLLNSVILLPETKRAGRIFRAQPTLIIPELPPDRPRTRISDRRPGPDDAYFT